jgi:predicted amidohydrolase
MMANLISIQINGQAKPSDNLAKIEAIVEQAFLKVRELNGVLADAHSLVVLPECFSVFGVSGANMLQHAETQGSGIIQERLSKLATQYRCYIVAGTTPIIDTNKDVNNGELKHSAKYYAASLVFSPSGKCIARYDKIHLFDVEVEDATKSYRESKYTHAGEHLSLFKTPFAEVAQTVCYDLRFADMISSYSRYTQSKQAPDVIVVPSAFTYKTGSAHWHALLKARSIESQCYIVAANQVGTHADNRSTFGNSCIYSPWGECLSLIENEEGFALASFDKDTINAIRTNMPIGAHKKNTYSIKR